MTNGDHAAIELFHWTMWDTEEEEVGEPRREVLIQLLREKAAELGDYLAVYRGAL